MAEPAVMELALERGMTQPADHVTPPHIELLGAPEVRPFEEALADAHQRWKVEVERYREKTVFADHNWSAIQKSASRD
jgi:hypothetical protein